MMFSRRRALGLAAVVALSRTAPVNAQTASAGDVPPEVAAAVPGARLQGSGTLRVLFFRVYDARLWHGEQVVGADFMAAPLALEAVYARSVGGQELVEETLKQLHLQSPFDEATGTRWRQRLQVLLPTVKEGDRLTVVNEPGRGLQMFLNGRATGRIDDPRLAGLFLGIWLAPQTSQPALRQALLGNGVAGR